MTFSRPSPFGTSLILAALLVLLLTQCGPSGGSEASGTANAPDRSGAAADGEIPLGIAPVHWDATRPAAKPGLVGPLHTISLTSSSLELTRYFYEGGLRMTLDGPFPQPASKLHRQRQFWDLPDSIRWQTYRLHRPETPDAIQIRLLLLQHETPPVHQTPEARELGPLLLGFTNRHQARLDDSLRAKGFATLTGGTTRRLASAEGGDYRFYETVFRAPDFTLVAGIEGLDEPAALGPLEAQTGMGGPSYAVHVVDSMARIKDFLTKVLDWEIRAEQSLTVAAGSAWGLPEGTVLNTALAYAKGATCPLTIIPRPIKGRT